MNDRVLIKNGTNLAKECGYAKEQPLEEKNSKKLFQPSSAKQ
jgi:hypothetical protein